MALPVAKLVGLAVILGVGAVPVALTQSLDRLPGPFHAVVTRIIDGDTVEVTVPVWLGQTVTTNVRIEGIDTPELRGKCEAERVLAAAARDRLAALIGDGPVILTDVRYDKFGGRVVARLADAQGADAGLVLVSEGLARPFDGRGARLSWCPVEDVSAG